MKKGKSETPQSEDLLWEYGQTFSCGITGKGFSVSGKGNRVQPAIIMWRAFYLS